MCLIILIMVNYGDQSPIRFYAFPQAWFPGTTGQRAREGARSLSQGAQLASQRNSGKSMGKSMGNGLESANLMDFFLGNVWKTMGNLCFFFYGLKSGHFDGLFWNPWAYHADITMNNCIEMYIINMI